jgi:hypothetical protein
MIHTKYNIDTELIHNILDGEGFTEIYHKTVKLRISDSQTSWILKVWEEVYQEFVKQFELGMTVPEQMKMINKISSDLIK